MKNWELVWNNADVQITMHDLLDRTRKCEGTAMDVCGQVLNYTQFHERSDLFAAWLESQGYGTGDMIILSMNVSTDLYCMIEAVIKAGAIVIVTEADITRARLDELIRQTEALKERCGKMGISLPGYVEYCFGKGLLAAMNRKEIWFTHLFSGRDSGFPQAEHSGLFSAFIRMKCSSVPMKSSGMLSCAD